MKKQVVGLILWIVVSLAAGVVGSQFMPGAWYAALDKPSWNPPGWVFGPVWTTLYILMGLAAWQVWRKRGFKAERLALSLFLVQLVANALWSYLFFGAQQPAAALVDIVILWLLILATTIKFWRVSTVAGAMMLPYLAWVGFATVLNFTLWRLNA